MASSETEMTQEQRIERLREGARLARRIIGLAEYQRFGERTDFALEDKAAALDVIDFALRQLDAWAGQKPACSPSEG